MSETRHRPLPVAIEEIDSDWLSAALRTGFPGAQVKDFSIERMLRGTCTKIFLRLDLNEAARVGGIPERVVLKGGFEPHSRDLHFMHQHEVRAYRDLLPTLGLHAPICYFADYDAERRQGIVILEDLTRRGVSFCNPLKPHTFEAVARRLSALADYHARSWDSPEFAPGCCWEWLKEITVETRRMDSFFAPEIWQRLVELPRGAAASIHFHDKLWVISALDALVKLSRQVPHAILHTDTHLGNLYIEQDGTPGFFDCVSHRGPAMIEIAYHLGCALDPLDRRRWERPLIQHYLDELTRASVAAPNFDEAMRQYGLGLSHGYFIFLVNASEFQREAVNTAYTARFSAAMIDNDTLDLVKAVHAE